MDNLTNEEKDNVKVDFLVDYVDEFPIYLINYKNSGKNIFYRNAREAGTDMFDKDISKAAKDNKRIARNCLAPALGFDVDEESKVGARLTGYGFYWDVTFPEDLPNELKDTYVSRKRRIDPSYRIEHKEVLSDDDYADAFSNFVIENFDKYDIATVNNVDIVLPVSYRKVWAKPETGYKKTGVMSGNSAVIDEIPYFDLPAAMKQLDFDVVYLKGVTSSFTHDGFIKDGSPSTWKAVRYAKAIYETKSEIVPDDDSIAPNVKEATRIAYEKYDFDTTLRYRSDDVGGIYKRRSKDDPVHIRLNKYSFNNE